MKIDDDAEREGERNEVSLHLVVIGLRHKWLRLQLYQQPTLHQEIDSTAPWVFPVKGCREHLLSLKLDAFPLQCSGKRIRVLWFAEIPAQLIMYTKTASRHLV